MKSKVENAKLVKVFQWTKIESVDSNCGCACTRWIEVFIVVVGCIRVFGNITKDIIVGRVVRNERIIFTLLVDRLKLCSQWFASFLALILSASSRTFVLERSDWLDQLLLPPISCPFECIAIRLSCMCVLVVNHLLHHHVLVSNLLVGRLAVLCHSLFSSLRL